MRFIVNNRMNSLLLTDCRKNHTIRKSACLVGNLVLLGLCLFFPEPAGSESYFSESGKSGLSFLAIAPSSRIASLGNGGTAFCTGASSLWSNPSLIALDDRRSAQFTHTDWIEGIRQEYAAFSTKMSRGSLGLGLQLFDSGDIEGRDESGDYTGIYSDVNVAVSLGYAYQPADWISLGAAYKKLFQKVSEETAAGDAFDFGVSVKTPVQGLLVGATGRNYGRMGKLRNARTNLPSDVAFGLSYSTSTVGKVKSYALLADVVVPKYGDTGIRLGVEVAAVDYLTLRIGYRNDSEFEDFIYGIGLNWDKVTADIAYTPMKDISDNALRFTLSLAGF